MSLTIGEVVTAARDQSPAFDRTRTTDAVIVRWLTTYERATVAEVARINPDAILSTLTIPAPVTAGEANPHALPSGAIPRGGRVTFTGGTRDPEPLTLVPWERRYRFPPGYSGWTQNGNVYLAGEDADWDDVATVEVSYTGVCPALDMTAAWAAGPFTVGDEARETLIAQAALICAMRAASHPDTPEAARPDVEMFATLAAAAHERYLRVQAAKKRHRMAVVGSGR